MKWEPYLILMGNRPNAIKYTGFFQQLPKTQIKAETHEAFLAELLAMEVEARELNRKNILLKQAQFDVLKTFGDFRFEKMSIPYTIDVEALKTASFIYKKSLPPTLHRRKYGKSELLGC